MIADFADDIEWIEAAGFPLAGTYRGPDAVKTGVFIALGGRLGGLVSRTIDELVDRRRRRSSRSAGTRRPTAAPASRCAGAGRPRLARPRREGRRVRADHRHGCQVVATAAAETLPGVARAKPAGTPARVVSGCLLQFGGRGVTPRSSPAPSRRRRSRGRARAGVNCSIRIDPDPGIRDRAQRGNEPPDHDRARDRATSRR